MNGHARHGGDNEHPAEVLVGRHVRQRYVRWMARGSMASQKALGLWQTWRKDELRKPSNDVTAAAASALEGATMFDHGVCARGRVRAKGESERERERESGRERERDRE